MNYSIKNYRSIIEQALASGYRFVPFSVDLSAQTSRLIYLRHDVDYSLEMAAELACVNADLGVQGTFFVLLRSQVYNPLSSWSKNLLGRIHGFGQHLALHATLQHSAVEEIESQLRADFEFLSRDVPMILPVFSWHNPNVEVLERNSSLEKVAGLINVYSARFTKEAAYFSDSNMRHSTEDFLSLVSGQRGDALQLLFHPLNWVIGGSDMRDVFAGGWPRIIKEREQEMRLNRVYQQMLPEGMPQDVLQGFAEQWRRAALDK
jgi:hypothetical protein